MQAERATMTKRKRSRKKGWSYIAGEKGTNRVRVYEHAEKGLFAEWYEPGPDPVSPQKRVRMALGAIDREAAKEKADEIAVKFRKAEPVKPAELTLTTLFDTYAKEVTPEKGEGKRKHDERCRLMFLRYLGPNRKPKTLSRRDWDRFIADRRSGRIGPDGAVVEKPEARRPVRARIIAYDLKYLMGVLNWATDSLDDGGDPLLKRNPLKRNSNARGHKSGPVMPREESPVRPVLTSEQYAALREKAHEIGSRFELMLVLAHETGHRGASIRKLLWDDVDLKAKRIRWRRDSDKIGMEHITPLTDEAAALLDAERKRQKAIGNAPVFPASGASAKPMSRHLARDWFERAAKLAGLPKGERYGYHSLRRKFATELKDTPLKDLCALGGWKDPQTILTCYQIADEQTQRDALAGRRKFTASGIS